MELFCRTDALLPNLYVGMITRESISRALDSGISAEMIIGYLDQHAHPNVANKLPCVPSVVTDQVRGPGRQPGSCWLCRPAQDSKDTSCIPVISGQQRAA